MKISKVKIENYRNFENEIINFNNKTLIIGPNDVGKSNLIRALRLLLDKSLSQVDIEPEEKDFNIYTDAGSFKIEIEFDDYDEIKDEHVMASLGKYFSEDEKLKLTYIGYRDREETFKIYIGEVEEENEATSRFYLKTINLVYLNSTRNLVNYLKKGKERLIRRFKENRTDEQISSDNEKNTQITIERKKMNDLIDSISYVSDSTNIIKKHLEDISIHNFNNDIKFSVINGEENLEKNLELVAFSNGKNVEIGGDGRNNQIYLTMWLEDIKYIDEANNQTTFFAIEEPEAHLHPTIQSMTLRKIIELLESQLIVTTHSQQIALEFSPNSIIRLYYNKNLKTKVAKNGCSKEIEEAIVKMAYRNNIINAEMFFADVIFLVEGISEKMLYHEISKQLNYNIEKYNIIILSVEGVGFDIYTQILDILGIPYVIRTDNDIIKKRNDKFYCSGILRLTKIYNKYNTKKLENILDDLEDKNLSEEQYKLLQQRKNDLERLNLYLADIDLENDLVNLDTNNNILEVVNEIENDKFNKSEIIDYMQEAKGVNMYKIINHGVDFSFLKDSKLVKPLETCIMLATSEDQEQI